MSSEDYHPTVGNAVIPGIVIGLTLAGIYAVPQYLLNIPASLAENIFIATILITLAACVAFIVYLQSNKNLFSKTIVTS